MPRGQNIWKGHAAESKQISIEGVGIIEVVGLSDTDRELWRTVVDGVRGS
jgi:hypothetical protein